MEVMRRHLKVNDLGCLKFKRVQTRLDRSAGKTSKSELRCAKVKRIVRRLDRSGEKTSESK